MNRRDKSFGTLWELAIRKFPTRNEPLEICVFLFLLSLACITTLFYVGSTILKVILLSKMGKNQINSYILFLSFLITILYGWFLCTEADNSIFQDYTKVRTIITGIFFIIGAILILLSGLGQLDCAKIQKINDNCAGESYWLTKDEIELYKKGQYNIARARNFYHPFNILIWAGILCLFHPYLGIPFAFSVISYWIVLIIDYMLGEEELRHDLTIYNSIGDEDYTLAR